MYMLKSKAEQFEPLKKALLIEADPSVLGQKDFEFSVRDLAGMSHKEIQQQVNNVMDELDHSNEGTLGKNEFWALFRVATDEVNYETGEHDGESMTYE